MYGYCRNNQFRYEYPHQIRKESPCGSLFVFCVGTWCRTHTSDLLCTGKFDVTLQIARRRFLRLCVSKVPPPYTAKRRKLGQTGFVQYNRLLFNYLVIRTKIRSWPLWLTPYFFRRDLKGELVQHYHADTKIKANTLFKIKRIWRLYPAY